jgi:hypothetical protein
MEAQMMTTKTETQEAYQHTVRELTGVKRRDSAQNMCTNNPEIHTNTGSTTMDNLGQTLDVLSVSSMQCLINGINIQRQASSQGARKTACTGQKEP